MKNLIDIVGLTASPAARAALERKKERKAKKAHNSTGRRYLRSARKRLLDGFIKYRLMNALASLHLFWNIGVIIYEVV